MKKKVVSLFTVIIFSTLFAFGPSDPPPSPPDGPNPPPPPPPSFVRYH